MPLRLRLRDLAARGSARIREEQGRTSPLRLRAAGRDEDGVRARGEDALRLHGGGKGGGVYAVLHLRVLEDGGRGGRAETGALQAGAGGREEPAGRGAGGDLRRRGGEEPEVAHRLEGRREC